MSKRNAAASAKQRLLNLSRKTGEDFQLLLTRYAIERLLARLCASPHAGQFVLKGAVLFALWTGEMHRPTRDLDLLGFGDASAARLTEVFKSICAVSIEEDGLLFHADTVTVGQIREDQEYGGQRLRLEVTLGQARIDLQVDVGFGDAITPAAETVEYPTLLGMEAPKLRAYPKETVVAEKLEAMVKLGLANSRMKDFYDLLVMSHTFTFEGEMLRDAIAATFKRRGTAVPTAAPVALTEDFAKDDAKRRQWKAFRTRGGIGERVGDLDEVVTDLARYLLPPLTAAAAGQPFASVWEPGGSWRDQAGTALDLRN